jgi:hypothetical protein
VELVAPPEERASAALAAYLSALPAGLASHPQCQVKGSVLRGLFESTPVPFPRAILPPQLVSLVDDPPLPTDWISEVHFVALMTAHESQLTASAHERWVYERNQRLLRSPLYAVLFRVVGPSRVFSGMANRWRAFRRWTELTRIDQGDRHAAVELRYPTNLYSESALVNVCGAFRAVFDASGATSSHVRVTFHGPTSAIIEAKWT